MISFLKRQSQWKLSLLSGVLIGLSYPPLKLGFFAWFGLVPLLIVLSRESLKRGFWNGFLAGVGANVIAVYWLAFNIGTYRWAAFLSMVSAVFYLALFWGLIGLAFTWVHTRTGKGFLILPFLWVSVEYFVSLGTLGFSWISLATTQVEYLPLIQIVEVTGIYGITFWLIVLNILIYRMVDLPRITFKRTVILCAVLFVIPWILGGVRLVSMTSNPGDNNTFRVSLVQPNVFPKDKWDPSKRDWNFHHLDSLFVEVAKENPQLVIWPESAVPAYLRKNRRRLKKVVKRVTETNIPLLTGTIDWQYEGDERKVFNGVLLIKPADDLSIFHKIHLVPFGEYVPLSDWFPVLDEINLGQGNYDNGDTYTIFDVDSIQFASCICFEAIFPGLVREFVRRDAKFLVVVVNDGWYGNTSEPFQHAMICRFRAIENRMPLVRCANTGISVIYDAAGRIVEKLSVNREGILSAGILPKQVVTFYAKHGDIFVQLCLFLGLIFGGFVWFRNR